MRRTIRLTVIAALALAATTIAPSLASAGPAPTDLLPDLRMAKLYGLDLEFMPSGKVRLRFGSIGWNMGVGPLEVRATRPSTSQPFRVKQRIYDTAGGYRGRVTPTVMTYAGDGHNHHHVRQFMLMNMYTPGDPGGDNFGLRKLGYCLLDAERKKPAVPGSPPSQVYPGDACGSQGDLNVTMGLSVGWGDDYPPYFAHQYMDITGLAAGTYRICATVDPLNDFLELDETNNQRWTDVSIDIAADHVAAVGTFAGPCGPTVSPAQLKRQIAQRASLDLTPGELYCRIEPSIAPRAAG